MSGRAAPRRSSAAGTRSARRRRPPARSHTTIARRVMYGLALLTVAVIAIGLARFDFGDTIREITLPLRHDDIIRQEAGDEDIATVAGESIVLPPADPALLAAVIYAESRFSDQTSSQGARGLMQITPPTADTIEKLSGGQTFVYDDLSDPDLNIRYGSYYLRYLLEKYEGNEAAALAAYNAGEGNVDQWGGAALEVEDIGFPETRAYVVEVLDKRGDYRNDYAKELGL